MLTAAALLVLVLVLAGLAVWLARALGFAARRQLRSARGPKCRGGPATAGADRGGRPAARRPRYEGRPAYGARVAADERDPQAARRRRPRNRAAGRAGQGPRTAPAGPAPAQGARRLRRAPARQPPARPAPGGRLPLQYAFRGGERVDAVIRVDKLVPVDAKFPLDNFERLANAEDDDARSCTRRRSRAT